MAHSFRWQALLLVAALGVLLSMTAGCHIEECCDDEDCWAECDHDCWSGCEGDCWDGCEGDCWGGCEGEGEGEGGCEGEGEGGCEGEGEGEGGMQCVSNRDCAVGELCFDGTCRQRCGGEDEDCGEGQNCAYGLICMPAGEEPDPLACAADADCTDGFECLDGTCTEKPEPQPCAFNAECGEAEVCLDGTCHGLCATDAECGDDLVCDRGICKVEAETDPGTDPVPVTECATSADCSDGRQCLDGVCAQPCWTECDCDYRSGEVCENGFCVSQQQ